MLNVGRLKVLTEVVGRGSFSAAAEALSYTQSAVSQAIARLEAETGTTLVIRNRQGIRPTAAGATLVEHAETIFAQIDAAETDLAAVLGVRIGRLQEAVRIMKGLFSEEPVDFAGKHYTVRHNGMPKPVQKPHPPILIGGGGRRVLRFAAREADIIGINFDLREGVVNREVMITGTAAARAGALLR